MASRVIDNVRSLNEYAKKYVKIVEESLEAAIDNILEESQTRIPKNTYSAYNSKAKNKEITKDVIKIFAGYGLQNTKVNPRTKQKVTDYIVDLHEDMTAIHKNGEAKFLSNAFKLLNKSFYDEFKKRRRSL